MTIKKLTNLTFVFALCIALVTISVSAQDNATNQTGGLVINELDINVDYEPTNAYNVNNLKNSQPGLVNGSTTEADIYPGSSVEFVLEIENTFKRASDNSDDIIIDDVSAKIIIEGIGENEEDIEKDSTAIELEPEEEQDFFVSFNVPKKVDARTYDVKIEVEGDGRNDVVYTVNWDLKLDIKKPAHDIRIERMNLANNKLECSRSTELTATIFNAGRNNEDEIKLEITNDNLNINQYVKDIELGTSVDPEDGADIDFENKFPISVSDRAAAGTYPINANVYWNDILFDSKSIDLVIENCEERQPEATTTTTTTSTIPLQEEKQEEPPAESGFIILTGDVAQEDGPATNESREDIFVSREFSLTKGLFWPLVIGANLILVIVIAGIVLFVRK